MAAILDWFLGSFSIFFGLFRLYRRCRVPKREYSNAWEQATKRKCETGHSEATTTPSLRRAPDLQHRSVSFSPVTVCMLSIGWGIHHFRRKGSPPRCPAQVRTSSRSLRLRFPVSRSLKILQMQQRTLSAFFGGKPAPESAPEQKRPAASVTTVQTTPSSSSSVISVREVDLDAESGAADSETDPPPPKRIKVAEDVESDQKVEPPVMSPTKQQFSGATASVTPQQLEANRREALTRRLAAQIKDATWKEALVDGMFPFCCSAPRAADSRHHSFQSSKSRTGKISQRLSIVSERAVHLSCHRRTWFSLR